MAIKYEEVDQDVLDVAQKILEKYHENLLAYKFGFVFIDPAPVRAGNTVWATISKTTAKNKMFMDYDYVIQISQEIWDDLSYENRCALIDHELMHIGMNGSLIGHDFEGFQEELRRWGPWTNDLFQLEKNLEAYNQHMLPGTTEPKSAQVGAVKITDTPDIELLKKAKILMDSKPDMNVSQLQMHLRCGFIQASKIHKKIQELQNSELETAGIPS